MQVLSEYYVNVTQNMRPGLTHAEAWSDVEALRAWEPIPTSFALLERGYRIQMRYGLSWWDSLIVAAAVESSCKEIISEDLGSGQVYEGVAVINPFAGLLKQRGRA